MTREVALEQALIPSHLGGCAWKGGAFASTLLPSSETGTLVERQEWSDRQHLSHTNASIVSKIVARVFSKPSDLPRLRYAITSEKR